MKEIKVEVGGIYKRRDGLLACIVQKSNTTEFFRAVIIGTGEQFSIQENGKEYNNEETQNDLIGKIFSVREIKGE